MNKLLIVLCAILTSTISCRQSTKNVNSQGFSNYLQRIDPMILPYKSGCYDFIHFDREGKYSALVDTTYSSEWEIPFKRIKTNRNFEIVVYLIPADIYVPILKTFDLNGKEISEFQFFTNCDGEPGFRERQFVEIRQNLQIIKTDSIWRWELDEDYYEIESTKKIEVKRSIYEIDVNGLIIMK